MSGRTTSAASMVIGVILIVLGLPALLFGLMLAAVPLTSIVGVPLVFFGLLLLVGGGLLIYNAQRRPSEVTVTTTPPTAVPAQPAAPSGTAAIPSAPTPTRVIAQPAPATRVALAYLEAPSGRLIVSSVDQPFYRSDFSGIVPPGLLDTISQSKPQFIIRFRGGRFYIEDPGSTNGTLLNGRQIRGMGMQELRDGDIISPAGVVNLVFRTVS